MVSFLQSQLQNADEIKGVLKEVQVSYELSDGREVRTLLTYLPIDYGENGYSEFFEIIRKGILYNFVFSCKEVEKKLGLNNPNSPEDLFDKAIRKLSKHTAKGELGELILFTLLDIYYQAPKLLSKVALKTNRRMPVFGADAVHGQFHEGQLKLYLGESKLHTQFKGAATKAAGSIKGAIEKYEDEFDLLDSYMDFPNIDEASEALLLELLNPFSDNDLSGVIHSPCFIGFSDKDLVSNAKTEDEFVKKYTEVADTHIEVFFAAVEAKELDINDVSLLMLPFTCVDALVDEFVTHMGISA